MAPHTHTVGYEVYTKIIRKGNDIGYLFKNDYYDFNYQNIYTLNPPVNITKVSSFLKYLYENCNFNLIKKG